MKLLHLVPDDKFTESAQYYFNKESSCDNKWLIIKGGKLKYAKHCSVMQKSLINIWLGTIDLSKFDFIIVHSLRAEHIHFILRHKSCKYVWVGMGYDYYDLQEKGLYLPFSQDYISQKKIKASKIINRLKKITKSFLWHSTYTQSMKVEAINSISFFAPVLDNEFHWVNKKFKKLKFIDWNYGISALIIKKNPTMKSNANSILVGNSSDPTNNHFEILKLLESSNINEAKIYLPLSYGDKSYKELLLSKFRNSTLNINVLDKFMNKDTYFELLSDCRCVIMNHIRQQAGGNIVVMLFMGSKVFLNENSPFYTFYKAKGAIIYTVDELKKNRELLSVKLSKAEVEINRRIILIECSENRISNKTKLFIMHIKESMCN